MLKKRAKQAKAGPRDDAGPGNIKGIRPKSLVDKFGSACLTVGESLDTDDDALIVGADLHTLGIIPAGIDYVVVGDNFADSRLVGCDDSFAKTAHFVGGTHGIGRCGIINRIGWSGHEVDNLAVLDNRPEKGIIAVVPCQRRAVQDDVGRRGSLFGKRRGIPVVVTPHDNVVADSVASALVRTGLLG